MHSIQIYIDEILDSVALIELKTAMMNLPHVTNVELNSHTPHDMLIEYEAHYNVPMLVMDKLHHKGLHSDIISA